MDVKKKKYRKNYQSLDLNDKKYAGSRYVQYALQVLYIILKR